MTSINTEDGFNRPSQSQSHEGSKYSSHLSSAGTENSGFDSDSPPDEEDITRPGACKKVIKGLQCIDAANLELNPMDPGNWDEWGVYYCSSRFGRHSSFNPNYFALAAIVVVGQCNFFTLIQLMHENGGIAFILVLAMTYISFGYPAYILEMLMGQYSGRKPIWMVRYLMPVYSGLGMAFYIRTLARAVSAVGNFSYCLYHGWDLLFCKGVQSVVLKRILVQEKEQRTFKLFLGLTHRFTSGIDPAFMFEKPFLIILAGCTFLACFKKLKEFGAGMKVVLRLLLLFLAGYTFTGYQRTHAHVDSEGSPDTFMFLPFYLTFQPNWLKLMDGWVWVKGIMFAVQSLELGTLLHPYLGSKVFFHYRCTRDGIYLILVTLTWNLIGVIGVLLWLGYVCIDEKEIKASYELLGGQYGMFVVFILKHLQAELSAQVEGDVLLFCSVFYFITGTAAFFAAICYMYILIDCTFPESGHPMMKLTTMIAFTVSFVCTVFPIVLSDNGLRHLIFINFYLSNSWISILIIICYTSAVAWSQGMARVLHDFYNILHLKGYEVRTHFYYVPKIIPFLYIGFLVFAMISSIVELPHPTEGSTDWTDPGTILCGQVLRMAPLFVIVVGAVYYLIKERKDKSDTLFEPHRDFYKNKYHVSVCFKDYQYFDPHKLANYRKSRDLPKKTE